MDSVYEEIRAERGRFRSGLEAFGAANYIIRGEPRLLHVRGSRLAELGRLDEAETDFNRMVELAAEYPEALVWRGNFFADRKHDPDQAAADYEAALRLANVTGAGRAIGSMNTWRIG